MRSLVSAAALLVFGVQSVSATTVAFDRVNLAADTQVTNGHRALKTKSKIFYSKARKAYIGMAGNVEVIQRIADWFINQTSEKLNVTGEFQALYVTEDGVCRYYDGDMNSYVVMDDAYAIGSGTDFALAAMACGKSAKEAVRIASQLDIYTNSEISSYKVVRK